MTKSIGESISELRQGRGISQSELAKRAKLSLKAIEQIENDDDTVSLGSVKRAAVVLGCWPALRSIPRVLGEEPIDKADKRYTNRNDQAFWENRTITIEDLPYMFPEEDDESRYQRVLDRATEVFESRDSAETWMTSEVPALSGEKPVELLKQSDGEDLIFEVLGRIESGDFS